MVELKVMSERKFPCLQGERVLLRVPEPGDEVPLLEFYKRNDAFFKPFDPPRPKDFFQPSFWARFVSRSRHEFEQGASCRMIIFCPNSPGRMIGKVNLTQVARGPFQACYLGYAIDREEQGKGKMYEAAKLAIHYALYELRLHRIMANYLPTNERSARLLRRLGFVVEGYARDYLYINGAWRDHILTSLTHSNWGEDLNKPQ